MVGPPVRTFFILCLRHIVKDPKLDIMLPLVGTICSSDLVSQRNYCFAAQRVGDFWREGRIKINDFNRRVKNDDNCDGLGR